MGLGSRIGLVFVNFLTFIPLIALLLAAAIMSSIGAANLAKLSDQNDKVKNAYKWTTGSTVFLWISFAVSIVSVLIIPTIASFPYLYGIATGTYILFDIALAGIFFYAADAARTSKDYKDGDADAKMAFNMFLSIGIIMLIAAILLGIYTFWGIKKYRKEGGLTSDVRLGTQIFAPEYGAFVQTYAGKPTQQEQKMQQQYQQLSTTADQLYQGQQQYGGGLRGLYRAAKKNPELFAEINAQLK